MNRPKNYTPPPAGIPAAILCSATVADRPPGVSILDSMTYEYEKSTGRKSALPAAIVAKLEAHARLAELRSETRAVTASMSRPAPHPAVTATPPSLYSFIRNGKLPEGTAEKDLREMLSLARDLIQSYRETTSPAPAPDGTITAAQFTGPPPVKMLKSEFDKMSDSNKSRYIREGGKLVADPKPARR
jgi:hypothetical protein